MLGGGECILKMSLRKQIGFEIVLFLHFRVHFLSFITGKTASIRFDEEGSLTDIITIAPLGDGYPNGISINNLDLELWDLGQIATLKTIIVRNPLRSLSFLFIISYSNYYLQGHCSVWHPRK